MRGPRLEKWHGFAASLTALLEGQNPRLDLVLSIVFLVPALPLPMTPPSSFRQVTGTIFVVFRASRSHMVGTVSTNPFPLYI